MRSHMSSTVGQSASRGRSGRSESLLQQGRGDAAGVVRHDQRARRQDLAVAPHVARDDAHARARPRRAGRRSSSPRPTSWPARRDWPSRRRGRRTRAGRRPRRVRAGRPAPAGRAPPGRCQRGSARLRMAPVSSANPSTRTGSRFSGASRASDRIRSPGAAVRRRRRRSTPLGMTVTGPARVPLVPHRLGRRAADGDRGVEATQAGRVGCGHHPRLACRLVVDDVVDGRCRARW